MLEYTLAVEIHEWMNALDSYPKSKSKPNADAVLHENLHANGSIPEIPFDTQTFTILRLPVHSDLNQRRRSVRSR